MTLNYCDDCKKKYEHTPDDKTVNKTCYHYWVEHMKPKIDKQYKEILTRHKQRHK